MNLSMYTAYARGLDRDNPARIFRHFYEKGVRFGDIIDDELNEIGLSDYCKNLKDAGIIPEALVVTTDIVTAENVEENLVFVYKHIDEMQKQGVHMLMAAPAVRSARTEEEFFALREKMVDSFGKVIDYAKGSDVTVMIENQSVSVRPDSKISDIRYLLDSLPKMKFVLDSGNFYCVGEDVVCAYEVLKDRLVHSHVKDWRTNPFGTMIRENLPRFEGCAIGGGILPLAKLLKKMKSDGYRGNIVLEVNACDITLDVLNKSCDFLIKHI